MNRIDFTKHKIPEKTSPKYPFQEICLEIAKLAGVKPWLVFALWKKRGWEIRNILAEIKQGEVKNPEIYIKYLLKNN